jgi:hypothetical protein
MVIHDYIQNQKHDKSERIKRKIAQGSGTSRFLKSALFYYLATHLYVNQHRMAAGKWECVEFSYCVFIKHCVRVRMCPRCV